MPSYDCLVIGTGGAGSAALDHLARRGVRALGLDRFPPAHDRGSSHGRTRIIRQAYFEHADYVPLAVAAYEAWAALEQRTGRRLLTETGLLQIGPAGGEVLRGVRRAANLHGLAVEELSAEQIAARFAGYRVPPGFAGVYEQRAGYLRVEDCVAAHLEDALKLGAELRTGEAVVDWQPEGSAVRVRTEAAAYTAGKLILTPGAWAPQLLADLGVKLQVRRKPQYWYEPAAGAMRVEDGCPAFLYELPEGVFYGFPRIDSWGVKVARHSGGEVVADPLQLDRDFDAADRALVEAFLAEQLPGVTPQLNHHSMCMYTVTADEHFLVDVHPQHPQVALAAGLSGHGFKFTSVLGQALAELALDGRTDLPVGFLNCRREGLRSYAFGAEDDAPEMPEDYDARRG